MKKYTLVIIAFLIYLAWISTTYILEGRVNLLQKNDPIGRLEYIVIANIVIGIVIPLVVLRFAIMSGMLSAKQIGFRSMTNTALLTAIAGIAGLILFLVQGPASLNPIAIINVFLQTLPTSIAEVIVCWVIVGTSIESLANNRLGKNIALMLALAVSIILFGVYHFAHSEPFNQPQIVVFLMLPGVLTSIVYFFGRNLYAAIVFHNFQALFGVLAAAPLFQMLQIQPPVVLLASVSILSLIIMNRFVIHRIRYSSNEFQSEK
ncbi:CPBP family intramembrane glutamic endopeptidase [Candidatus Nitrosocosmicus sp. T]